jgi:hypothetical protein
MSTAGVCAAAPWCVCDVAFGGTWCAVAFSHICKFCRQTCTKIWSTANCKPTRAVSSGGVGRGGDGRTQCTSAMEGLRSLSILVGWQTSGLFPRFIAADQCERGVRMRVPPSDVQVVTQAVHWDVLGVDHGSPGRLRELACICEWHSLRCCYLLSR